MLSYYLFLALRSLKRAPIISALMVLAIGLGVGASITMLTVLHNLSGDPLPQRSSVLFHPQVDPRPASLPGASREPPDDLTYIDAVSLYHLKFASRRVLMSSNWLPTRSDVLGSPLTMVSDRATTSDFFSMFDVPLLYGSSWSAHDDSDHAQVVLLSRNLNDKLFGGVNSVGKELVIATRIFRVIGVIGDWNPQPHFYDLGQGAYDPASEMYLPFFTWLYLPQDYGYGPMNCWGDNPSAGLHNPQAPQCTWAQFWVELDTPTMVANYRTALIEYSREQRHLGRFHRAPNVRLRSLLGWLSYKQVIPVTVHMQFWISFGVFLICMVNVIGLLMAKFLRKSSEIGIRRALGATHAAIFSQCVIEAGLVGAAGGLLSLPLAWSGLWMVRQQPVTYAASVQLNLSMLAAALALAIVATLTAGVWPAWCASRVAPALQVKSQ